MSRGRRKPATLSTRTSKLTRTFWVPLTIRLPFGSTSVTTAATRSSMLSERVIVPSPLDDVLESRFEPIVASPFPLAIGVLTSYFKSYARLCDEFRDRSDVLSSEALSLIEILTVTTSPTRIARGSRKRSALASCQKELSRRETGIGAVTGIDVRLG